jgi:hypothetical protein
VVKAVPAPRPAVAAGFSGQRALGWTAVAVGGLAAGVGGWLWSESRAAGDELEQRLAEKDGQWITGIDASTASSERKRLEGEMRLRGGIALAGGLVAAAGMVLVATAPERAGVALVPGPGGGVLAVASGVW